MMKTLLNQLTTYEAPTIQLFTFTTEKGFAQSDPVDGISFENNEFGDSDL